MIQDVKTRQEMAALLENVMTSAYEALRDELRLERNNSLLKTYIIEAHKAANVTHDELLVLITNSFKHTGRRKGSTALTVVETHEADLFGVFGNTAKGMLNLLIDTTDPRFWLVHAVSKSETSDNAISGVLEGSSELDSAWMPIELLNHVMHMGEPRGLGLDFDRRYIDYVPKRKSRSTPVSVRGESEHEATAVPSEHHLEYAKLQLWGTGAQRILGALSDADLGNSTTLSKVRLRNEDSQNSDNFALTDVKYDGKVTGRGTSFDTYNNLLLSVRNTYSKAVQTTERRFQLGWNTELPRTRKGEPFYIYFGEYGITNLEHLCARLFSGGDPFRLMALPIRRSANFFTASAVDLHVNQKIDFEISRKAITAYLPSRACGNSLLRLYTNLQHYLSSDVRATDGVGQAVFSFQS